MNPKQAWRDFVHDLKQSIREWLNIPQGLRMLKTHADESDKFLSEIMLETCNGLTDVDVVLAEKLTALEGRLAEQQLVISNLTDRLRYYESNILNYHKIRYEQQRSA